MKIPGFLSNFLLDINFKVCVGSTLSDVHNKEEGNSQGSILLVTLFSIKINSIIKCLNPGIDSVLYVDDLMICYRSKYIHIIEYQLQLNVKKINREETNNGFWYT